MDILEKIRKRFKPYGYELCGSKIIGNKGEPIEIENIATWQQVFLDIGVWNIVFETIQGESFERSDEGELLAILKNIVPELELPFNAI